MIGAKSFHKVTSLTLISQIQVWLQILQTGDQPESNQTPTRDCSERHPRLLLVPWRPSKTPRDPPQTHRRPKRDHLQTTKDQLQIHRRLPEDSSKTHWRLKRDQLEQESATGVLFKDCLKTRSLTFRLLLNPLRKNTDSGQNTYNSVELLQRSLTLLSK